MESKKLNYAVKATFLFLKEESDFREVFQKEFLNAQIFYKGIPVSFKEGNFSHICYEKGEEGKAKAKFGIRRARRILLLKEILNEKVPAELRYEPSSGNYCLLCEELDFVIFLVPVKKNKTLQVGTIIHFGEGYTKAIDKQKRNTQEVDKIVF